MHDSNSPVAEATQVLNGYANSRLNALKHGILSKELVLPHESKEQFDELLSALEGEYSPMTYTEQILVEEL